MGTYVGRVYKVATTPSEAVWGGLWGFWLGLQIKNLTHSIHEKNQADALPYYSKEKADKVWQANKQAALAVGSTASAVSYLLTWAHGVHLIPLGSLYSTIASIAYCGYSYTSSIKLHEALKNIYLSQKEGENIQNCDQKHTIYLKRIGLLLDVAMHVAFIAWGVFGMASLTLGGVFLAAAEEKALVYSLVLIGLQIFNALILAPKEKQASV